MAEAEHDHAPAHGGATQLPPARQRYLDGSDLLAKTQALRLASVDNAGWPHDTLLSAGDMLGRSLEGLRFGPFARSTTAGNLARDGRAVLTLALEAGLCEGRLRVSRLQPDEGPLALYEGMVDELRMHVAPCAEVTSGIVFRLHQPDSVLPRWRRQLAALQRAK